MKTTSIPTNLVEPTSQSSDGVGNVMGVKGEEEIWTLGSSRRDMVVVVVVVVGAEKRMMKILTNYRGYNRDS
jgi:hypothetical protein